MARSVRARRGVWAVVYDLHVAAAMAGQWRAGIARHAVHLPHDRYLGLLQ
jgi:hypothetical protein